MGKLFFEKASSIYPSIFFVVGSKSLDKHLVGVMIVQLSANLHAIRYSWAT